MKNYGKQRDGDRSLSQPGSGQAREGTKVSCFKKQKGM